MTKIKFTLGLLLLSIFSISISSCKNDIDLSTAPTISFKDDIQAIISGNCAMNGCHGTDKDSDFPLTTYNEVMNEGGVKAGDAKGSKFYQVLLINFGEKKMPPKGPLTDKQIKKVFIWIEQGALNN
ncbi:MAG: cytochrome c [Sphingobacteriales bacterium]|jgi:hypothetical protein|nr:cytochrome c [Sphingobacteriales bacterium]